MEICFFSFSHLLLVTLKLELCESAFCPYNKVLEIVTFKVYFGSQLQKLQVGLELTVENKMGQGWGPERIWVCAAFPGWGHFLLGSRTLVDPREKQIPEALLALISTHRQSMSSQGTENIESNRLCQCADEAASDKISLREV